MNDATSDRSAFQPWELRLLERSGLSPVMFGLSVTGALIGCLLVTYTVIGLPITDPTALFGLREGPRNFLLSSVLLGYSLGAFGYVLASRDRDLVALGLAPGAIRQQGAALRGRLIGAINVFSGYLIIEIVQRGAREGASALELVVHPEYTPAVILILLSFWVLGRFFHASIQATALDERLRAPVDLLDLRACLALGRMSLRRSLVLVGLITFQAPWVFIPGFSRTFVPLMAVALVVPTAMLLIPVRGARTRIRAAKRAELDRIDRELAASRPAAIRGAADAQALSTFLLLDRGRVESIHEWPFEGSSLRRFGLYLLLPLGSWGASALVERAINAWLD